MMNFKLKQWSVKIISDYNIIVIIIISRLSLINNFIGNPRFTGIEKLKSILMYLFVKIRKNVLLSCKFYEYFVDLILYIMTIKLTTIK